METKPLDRMPGLVYCPLCKKVYYIKEHCPCEQTTQQPKKKGINWKAMGEELNHQMWGPTKT